MKISNIKKILVLQPDHIGDVLLATPMIHAIRNRFPKAKIDILIGSWARDIVDKSSDIDTIYVYNFSKFNRSRQKCPSKLKTFLKLRKNRYDLCVMARSRNVLVRFFAFLIKAKHRIGFKVSGKDAFLNIRVEQKDPRQHVVDRNLLLAKELGADISNPKFMLKFSEGDKLWAKIFLELPIMNNNGNGKKPDFACSWGKSAGKSLVGINPGSGTEAKMWPFERFAKVADEIARRFNARIVITGSPSESDVKLAEQVASEMKTKPIIAAGRTDLKKLAALISLLDLYVSNDSGPLHIAVAVGTKVIGIYSGTDYPSMWGPYGGKHQVLSRAEDCDKLPCRKTICDYADHVCLKNISVKDVINAVKKYV
ncbi:MAG: hypothetical protein ACD_63C00076G0006 [uncultured bacterium]|nr:MAG: hypothetical protein ACD_63C00076G0006 [uncultured bacterium]